MDNTQSKLLLEIQKALPLRVIQAKRGVGSFLTLNLGRTNDENACRVWVYLSDWVIRHREAEILTSATIGIEGEPITWLSGQLLCKISFDSAKASIDFSLEDDLHLTLAPNLSVYNDSDNLVMFFRPHRRVLAFSCRNGFHETD